MSLQAAFIMILPSTRTCSTIMLYISSATNDPWPHPLHFIFSSYSSSSPTIRIHFPKHLNTCAPVHIILRFWTVCHQCYWMFTHGWMCAAVRVHFVILEVVILCVCVFWTRTWLNLCKIIVLLCRVLQKTLSKLERVCKQVKRVKNFKKCVFVSRTVWMVWKTVSNRETCISALSVTTGI